MASNAFRDPSENELGAIQEIQDRARLLREAGFVERCHTTPHVGAYPVSSHVYGMLVLLEALHPNPSVALFRAILLHDVHERYSGDVPGSIRWIDEEFAEALAKFQSTLNDFHGLRVDLTEEDARWLFALDKIEFLMWCHDQIHMGNLHAAQMAQNMANFIAEIKGKLPEPVRKFFDNFEWRRGDDF